MHFHVVTLFPESFTSYLGESILARAQKEKKIKISFYNPREFLPGGKQRLLKKKYSAVDDKPYGGGPGMVMQALPVLKAIEAAKKKIKNPKKTKVIFFSPSGKQFDTEVAQKYVKYTDIIFICGRYEGIDARVMKITKAEPVSVGPFVVTGGELPAMILVDCIARQIPGVLGNFNSREESRVSSPVVYTRPEVLEFKGKKYRVPKVLLGGNHKEIEAWKEKTKQTFGGKKSQSAPVL